MFESILAATSSGGSSGVVSILFLVVMVGLLYVLMIRPQQRRARQQRSIQSSVEPGDEVVTIGGIYGEVTQIDDETVVIEIAEDVEVRFVRSAISRKLVFDDGAQHAEGPAATKERGADDAK